MNEPAGASIERLVIRADPTALDREFEERLGDSSLLAFRVAYSVLRQREDAEDVAQEALARAYAKRADLRDRDRFRGWLARISWRLALDHRRAGLRRERRELGAAAPPAGPDAEEIAALNEFRERLFAAIERLPDKLRMTLVLAGIHGYDVGEVAALLEVPPGTVKSRIFRARRMLAEALR